MKRKVKEIARKNNVHVNSVWAELKKKYKFRRYAQMDCDTYVRLTADLNWNDGENASLSFLPETKSQHAF